MLEESEDSIVTLHDHNGVRYHTSHNSNPNIKPKETKSVVELELTILLYLSYLCLPYHILIYLSYLSYLILLIFIFLSYLYLNILFLHFLSYLLAV